ncbi:MAG: hypothetical protein IJ104_01940 [Methanobrevibacter sp.]|nr:hypothetical protein [Methanobrevibacter sp.]
MNISGKRTNQKNSKNEIDRMIGKYTAQNPINCVELKHEFKTLTERV